MNNQNMSLDETVPNAPIIALTFDDGPNTGTTNEVLDLLEKYGIKASFFVVGNNITPATEGVIKRAFELGCEIANHSKSHSVMSELSAEKIKEEIAYVSDRVKEITGKPTKFFRPPYIAVNKTMYENINMPFIAGMGCNDWDEKVTAEMRINKIKEQLHDGVIILLHDAEGNFETVKALKVLIPYMLKEGYNFVTVSELFEAKGIEVREDDTNLYSEL